jgi:hypothetical protein
MPVLTNVLMKLVNVPKTRVRLVAETGDKVTLSRMPLSDHATTVTQTTAPVTVLPIAVCQPATPEYVKDELTKLC